jgi:hypothetical protein
MTQGLNSIGMERNTSRPTQRRYFRNRLHCSDFVVGPHDGAQSHVAMCQRFCNVIGDHPT